MGRFARSLTALALTSIALVGPTGPSARASDDPPVAPPPPIEPYPLDTSEAPVVTTLADQIRAFRAAKFQEIDQAVFELRQLIAERSQQLARLESELLDAQQELGVLEALAELQAADAVQLEAGSPPVAPRQCHLHPPTPIEVPPGTLDVVVPASAEVEPQWQGVVRIASANGGRLDLLHESADGSGKVQAGALQADVIEIRVRSEQEARIIAQALKADDNAVVSWPDLRILAAPASPDPGRIDAIEATMRRLAETVDRIDRRTSSTGDHPSGDPIVVSPPAEIPPAPSIPD